VKLHGNASFNLEDALFECQARQRCLFSLVLSFKQYLDKMILKYELETMWRETNTYLKENHKKSESRLS
jgi:hypothetical protein